MSMIGKTPSDDERQCLGKIPFLFVLICLAISVFMSNGIAATNPANQSLRFSYDENGNIASRTDAAGVITTYRYDPMERLSGVEYPDKSKVNYQYDGVGRVTRMTDQHGSTNYEYDALGQLSQLQTPDESPVCRRKQVSAKI